MKRAISLILTVALSLVLFSLVSVAEDTVPVRFYAKQVSADDTTLTVQIRVAVSDSVKANSFGIYVDYDDTVLDLSSCSFAREDGILALIGGLSISSQTADAKPYRLLWTGGAASAGAGDYFVAALTFDVIGAYIPEGFAVTLAADPENPVIDDKDKTVESAVVAGDFELSGKRIMLEGPEGSPVIRIGDKLDLSPYSIVVKWAGTEGKTEKIAVTEDMISGFDAIKYGAQHVTVKHEDFEGGFDVVVAAVPGDADRSGTINLADVAKMMKTIAGWELDTEIDTVAADVDGNPGVNLNDVSLIMKNIAKWDVTLN